MGFFTKENCRICGGKTGLLDKKCSDGKICRDCVRKLSVWFDDYKSSTGAELAAQIAEKDNQLLHISDYNFSRVYGEMGVILIDEDARVFTAFADTSAGLFGSPRDVHSIDDVIDLRPDILGFDEITDIEIDINEMTREEKQTVNGSQVSYDPPHILYMYSFTLRIQLNNKYVKRVYIPLNKGTVQIKSIGRRVWTDPGRKLAAHLLDLPNLVFEDRAAVYSNESLLAAFMRSPYERPEFSCGFKVTNENWDSIRQYQYYLALAREIESCLKK